ncbi:MAG: tyrosine-protein phosphatase [Paracoccaceae bacterium]
MLNKLSAKLKSAENSLGVRLGRDISTPAARRRAFWHFHLMDHGILRGFWTNLAEIAPGVWRSNQPSPRRLRKYQKIGINTVLNLRGVNTSSPYLFEKEAADTLGMNLVSHRMSARSLVDKTTLLELLDVFETIDRPFVMHCKSGADRAGLASALYLLHIQGASLEKAKIQLSFKFLHLRSTQTGILDHVLNAYEIDTKNSPITIRNWIETRYDGQKLTAEFNAERGKS